MHEKPIYTAMMSSFINQKLRSCSIPNFKVSSCVHDPTLMKSMEISLHLLNGESKVVPIVGEGGSQDPGARRRRKGFT
jgi:hypothetical protein